MKTNVENDEEMSFKDYFESLDIDAKSELRDSVTPAFMAYTTFYYKLRMNSWSELELRKLEELTGKNFKR